MNTNKNFDKNIDIEENKDLSDDKYEKEYFNLDLTPKIILQTGLNMKHYIVINYQILKKSNSMIFLR